LAAVDRATVLPLYREGVDAVARVVDGWDDAQWSAPACGAWSGTDLAGHVLTVIGWYHSWLDRAEAGDATAAFPIGRLDDETARSLAALPDGTGPERIAEFVREATRYADRLDTHWDLPFGYPRGTVTAGRHAGLAASEWHLHAWDFARAAGGDHRPQDATTLYEAGAECLLAAEHGLAADLKSRLAPFAAKRNPWEQILRRSGRTP
jgi:uncharacterized protein (TIGR03083 family)